MEGRSQKSEVRKSTLFFLYLTAIVIMAIIYFSVPERKSFFEYQIKWWTEMWEVVTDRDQGSGIREKRD